MARSRGEESFKELLSSRAAVRTNLQTEFTQAKHIRRAAGELEAQMSAQAFRKPAEWDLQKLFERTSKSYWADRGLSQISKRDLRSVPWILFYPADKPEHWLGKDEVFVEKYGEWLSSGSKSRATGALLRQFLQEYPLGIPTFDGIRKLLDQLIMKRDLRGLVRWKERCQDYGLLVDDGPRTLVERWWKSEQSVPDYLEKAGLWHGLEASQFVERSTKSWLEIVKSKLAAGMMNGSELERALTWVDREGMVSRGPLRIQTANSLLSPFTGEKPREDVEEVLRKFFLNSYGDPRLVSESRWANVPHQHREVVLRMLVELALADFFRLLDKTALDRHWKYRKNFWTHYLDEGAITDAWIVLGRTARAASREVLENRKSASGALRQGGEAQHSVLLLKIAGITIAEWSHNGSCRCWLEGNSDAPKLYLPEYSRYDLVNGSDFSQPHYGSDTGLWQGKLGNWVAGQCGIGLPAGVGSGSYAGARTRPRTKGRR